MESQVAKMYENAGVKKEFEKPAECVKNPYITCNGCMLYDDKKGKCNNKKAYPPFTANKQLELVKWLCDTDYYITEFCRLIDTREYYIETDYKHFQSSSFEETLAGLINKLWQDLTEQERTEIADILKG